MTGWRPVSNAPRDGTRVVLFNVNTLRVMVGSYCPDYFGWQHPDAEKGVWLDANAPRWYRVDRFTHFASMPDTSADKTNDAPDLPVWLPQPAAEARAAKYVDGVKSTLAMMRIFRGGVKG